jgi:hypothetical protein
MVIRCLILYNINQTMVFFIYIVCIEAQQLQTRKILLTATNALNPRACCAPNKTKNTQKSSLKTVLLTRRLEICGWAAREF